MRSSSARAGTDGATAQPPAAGATETPEQIRRLAARAWLEMDSLGVLPTPQHFEIWYTHLCGSSPELSRRLATLLAGDSSPTAAELAVLHAECIGPELDVDAVGDRIDAIQQAADAMVEQINGNGRTLNAYGAVLSVVADRLGQDTSMEGLLRAVEMLTTETVRASERNRLLEQQLAASASRICTLRRSLAEVRQEATTDGLTGLSNRRAFDARLRRALVARNRPEGYPVSLLLLDVDHFKQFNDVHGHKVGDLVLRLVGRLLAQSVKGRDTAARYGGEEFAVILAGADLRAASIVAEQIRAALDGKRLVNKGSGEGLGSVTVSIGVAEAGRNEHASSLLERADAALYRAKHAGRNMVCVDEGVGRGEDAAAGPGDPGRRVAAV
ncbi:GGDEF domain-containing protein [Roseomonas sp. NAR14]|uniref:diguanylate cyclase n=1 Tax=Roseomonas acroporae TaxID=2937791 RepID=A0A9X2BZ95_9PROT|nr:GGDEF domain-containing protein [Roseomonas acroporae]MCK8786825.1 GGDEF domain-containing protein [Roseomonas acroporae]